MKKIDKEKLEMWAMDFIAEANTIQITDDGGDSFNQRFKYLIEKLMVKFKSERKNHPCG